MAKQHVKVTITTKGFRKPSVPKMAFLKRAANGKRKA